MPVHILQHKNCISSFWTIHFLIADSLKYVIRSLASVTLIYIRATKQKLDSRLCSNVPSSIGINDHWSFRALIGPHEYCSTQQLH